MRGRRSSLRTSLGVGVHMTWRETRWDCCCSWAAPTEHDPVIWGRQSEIRGASSMLVLLFMVGGI
jgi:hypothetical protein